MNKNDIKIAASLMCMDLVKFEEQLIFLNKHVDFYHVDIMDGHFTPNITLSPWFVQQVKKSTNIPIDAHLMVRNPEIFVESLADAGCSYFSPHVETLFTNNYGFRLMQIVKEKNLRFSIAINVSTPFVFLEEYLEHVEKITFMTVDPGFAGQKFIREGLKKVELAKNLKEKHNYKYLIEIDGSCNKSTYRDLVQAGAEVLILGSSGLFNLNEDISLAWNIFYEDLTNALKEVK